MVSSNIFPNPGKVLIWDVDMHKLNARRVPFLLE